LAIVKRGYCSGIQNCIRSCIENLNRLHPILALPIQHIGRNLMSLSIREGDIKCEWLSNKISDYSLCAGSGFLQCANISRGVGKGIEYGIGVHGRI